MNQSLRSDLFGPLVFSSGVPAGWEEPLLPQALCRHAQGSWGLVVVQELKIPGFLLRHFVFRLHQTLSFSLPGTHEGLQSLVVLRGELEYRLPGLAPLYLREKQFTFFQAGAEETVVTVCGGQTCSLFNSCYEAEAYTKLQALLPRFSRDLERSARQPAYFPRTPRAAPFIAQDDIEVLWRHRYEPVLQQAHVAQRMACTLLTLVAQVYTEVSTGPATALAYEKAAAARTLVLANIRVHRTAKDIAAALLCSEGWLKKAFREVYGVGMFQLLRRTRMKEARELLLRGVSVKTAALDVGMQPESFSKEFKAFYGYTVRELKRSYKPQAASYKLVSGEW